MSFNSSCSFAGIANMLESFDIEKEDYDVALGMKIPYLFEYDVKNKAFMTGPALQTRDLFNMYLNTFGVNLEEVYCSKRETCDTLKTIGNAAMIGIKIEANRKHAVVFKEYRENRFIFMNNRYRDSDDPPEYMFDEAELTTRIEDTSIIGWLVSCSARNTDFSPKLNESLCTLEMYKDSLFRFCEAEHAVEEIYAMKDSLFRPLMLDGLTMMQLIGNRKMSSLLKKLQSGFIATLKNQHPIALKDELPMDIMDEAIDGYFRLIKEQT